jgi:amino acid adenylation domain-containing protein
VYVQQARYTLPEPVDAARLHAAWSHVVQRHTVLRTCFVWDGEGGEPEQHVISEVVVPWAEYDWIDVPAAERDERLGLWLADDRRRGFNVAEPPLIRVALFQLGDELYELVWTFHHALLDGYSMVSVLREVFEVYEALKAGRTPQLPPALHYRNFIDWLASRAGDDEEDFWREQLSGFVSPGSFAEGKSAAAPTRGIGGKEQETRLSSDLTRALRRFGGEHGAGMGTVLQTAWAILLSIYNGQEDVAIGVTRTARLRGVEGADRIIGLLLNTVPLRLRVGPGLSLSGFTSMVRRQSSAVSKHAHASLTDIQQWGEVRPGTPLFLSILNYDEQSRDATLAATIPGGARRRLRLYGELDCPVVVNAYGDDELLLRVKYDEALFDDSRIARLLAHFEGVLRLLITSPETRVGDVCVLTEAERKLVLRDWNETGDASGAGQFAHELFEAQAARTPNRTAVCYDGEHLTYESLNERANRLAHYMKARGVGVDAPVGVYLQRSLDLAVAFLAVLKAGCAYMPLDPSHPRERLAAALADSGARMVLTSSDALASWPELEARAVCLDSERREIDSQPAANPRPRGDDARLAYVIYTSGSTGSPKGVMMCERALVNLIHRQPCVFTSPAATRTAQFAALSFDVSVQEMLVTWSSGGTLVFIPEDVRRDPEALLGLLSAERVERLFLPYVALQHLADVACESGRFPSSLREVITAGEQLRVTPLVAKFFDSLPSCVLRNQYGPTESHVVSEYVLGGPASSWEALPPIGRPIAGMQLYILDARLNPLPVGAAGELYISGVCLARGYVGRPRETAERFLPNPFAGVSGGRMYRTGDWARHRADGNIEFIGRRDEQVKIRGYRVEVGEVEAALSRCEGVAATAVVAHAEGAERRLVAYVVRAGAGDASGAMPDASSLRERLRELLPSYMVPAAFVFLPALPLTASGKVDRRALRPPPDAYVADDRRLGPQTPTEEIIAGVWEEVLGCRGVGVDENFFDCGGHSLAGVRVLLRLRSLLGVQLGLPVLFESPTVAALAARVDELVRDKTGDDSPPLRAYLSRGERCAASSAQRRTWFFEQMEPGKAVYHIPLAVRLCGGLDAAALEDAFSTVVRRHEALRTTFAVADGEPLQIVHSESPFRVAVSDLTTLPAESRAGVMQRIISEEVARPFDLAATLLRARLVRLGEEEHLLILVVHHIICDGWSLSILMRELSALYRAEAVPTLPPLAVQYGDYALWQRDYLESGVEEKQVAYWREQLAGAPPVLKLPADRPRPASRSYRGALHRFEVPPALTSALRSPARREGATLYMSLVAALKALLLRYTGETDIVVGVPVANRTRPELEPLVGCLVNTLPLRTRLSGELSFVELLRRVRRTTLDAYAHQDVPFERLVEALRLDRGLSHNPLFQTLLVMQPPVADGLALAGLEVEPVALPHDTAKFDLLLSFTELDGGLDASIEYSVELFDADTVARMSDHFLNLIAGVADAPETRLSALPILTDAERRLIAEMNDNATVYPRESNVSELFAAQAEQFPDTLAVIDADERLTYAELNRRANQLAHHLRRHGVGPESRVGICVERSAAFVTALLGALKAGGAYVPLDPTYPAERLSYMLADAGVSVLITTTPLLGRLPRAALSERGTPVIRLDADRAALALEATGDPRVVVSPANMAYVIYTSGSTGRPKGVVVNHRAIVRLVRSTNYVRLGGDDVMAQVSNASFDALTFEVWGALLNGGRLVVLPAEVILSPEEFAEGIRREGITTMFLTSALFTRVAAERPDAFATMRQLLVGGDAVDPHSARAVLRAGAPERLLNGYGPTETTTFAAWYHIREVAEAARTLPIGGPLSNTQLYVLDAECRPAPVGVEGELFIAGDGQARGYLGHAGLTAERFIPNPFSRQGGERMYRTGDAARLSAGGVIEFLGRRDRQVKIRGFRVEPGEVEVALTEHPSVSAAAVVARHEDAGGRVLTAYVTPAAASTLSAPELRGFLKERLPEYMIPSAFVVLERLPLTANGKVDRGALPPPHDPFDRPDEQGQPPASDLEGELLGIWCELFGRRDIEARDNFFELGGHSLLAAQVVSRVRTQLGFELKLRDLFATPTVAELARLLEGQPVEDDEQALRLLERVERMSPDEVESLLKG